MKVFGVPFSPFVRKVYLVAALKGVEIEPALANPRDPSPEFLACSPFRKMPAILDGDFALADSSAIAAYIDAKHPEPALYPADPCARGKAVWWEEFADTIVMPASGKVVFNRFVSPRFFGQPGDEAAAEQGVADLQPLFAYLETEAPASGWLAGEAFSIADIAVATALKTLSYVGVALDTAAHPKACAWYARVAELPVWQEVAAREAAAMSPPG